MADEPIINFASDRLAWGPCGPELIPLSLKWANDWQVSAPRGMPLRPYSLDTATTWNERNRADTSYWFVMYERSSLRPIGEAGFTNVDLFHRSAEYGIVIGETDCWNRGYGTEATRTMLHYGFMHLRLHMIWLRVSSANPAALRVYTKAGFRAAGRLREAQWIDGHAHDVTYMDCLAREFEG